MTRTAPPPDVRERQFQAMLADAARWLGYEVYFTWRSIHSPAGFPDLVLCRPPRLLLVELKSARGKLSPAQRRWGDLLTRCPGVEYAVWTPADWEAAMAILQGEEAPAA